MSKLLVDEISDADNTGPVTVTDGLTVQGAFTSLGIDDNATSTAITLDASGNLLVGKASAATNVQGGELRENGQVLAVATDVNPFFGARLGSDGDLAVFRKDSTTVGSIGTTSGDLTIDGPSEHTGLRFEATDITPRHNGALSNGVNDLGTSSARFKDLYLSGGVYLGGTGAANLLDDYEEGTFIPVLRDDYAGNAAGSSEETGRYTKIGRVVNFSFAIEINSLSGMTAGNSINITGLPYTVNNDSAGGGEPHAQILSFINNLASADYAGSIVLRPNNNTTSCELKYTAAGAVTSQGLTSLNVQDIGANTYLTGAATYETT
jgi:hypothetical protein